MLPVVLLILLVLAGPPAEAGRGILRAGLALALAMLLIGIALLVGRSLYLDAVTSPELPEAAARVVWDTLLHYMRIG